MSKFLTCRPNNKTRQIWCQHPNGKWAPPIAMGVEEPEVNEEGKKEAATPHEEE